jgi:hypothetical protein
LSCSITRAQAVLFAVVAEREHPLFSIDDEPGSLFDG